MERDEHEWPVPVLRVPATWGWHRTTRRGTSGSPRGDSTMARGTQRARHGQDHTPGEALGSGAVTWAGGASGTAGPASTGAEWAGRCSVQCPGGEHALCFPEDVVFSKTLRHFGLSF